MEGGTNPGTRAKTVRELTIKARFLNRMWLFSAMIFLLLMARSHAGSGGPAVLFVFSFIMEVVSLGFFVLTRRIVRILGNDPDVGEIERWQGFLSYYYYPPFIFRRRRNPYIVVDDEED